MNSILPHFGVVSNAIVASIRLDESNVPAEQGPSERTCRTISSGKPVMEKTWRDFGSELANLLISSKMLPFQDDDLERLASAFDAYRKSYEQFNDSLSRLSAPPETLRRAIMRLQFLDLAIRYAGLCLSDGKAPLDGLPLWVHADGGNQFWKGAMEKLFPGLPLVDSIERDGDCAAQLKMNPSRMRRSLYENGFPGVSALRKVVPDNCQHSAALRHYASFNICQKLIGSFGRNEVLTPRSLVNVLISTYKHHLPVETTASRLGRTSPRSLES